MPTWRSDWPNTIIHSCETSCAVQKTPRFLTETAAVCAVGITYFHVVSITYWSVIRTRINDIAYRQTREVYCFKSRKSVCTRPLKSETTSYDGFKVFWVFENHDWFLLYGRPTRHGFFQTFRSYKTRILLYTHLNFIVNTLSVVYTRVLLTRQQRAFKFWRVSTWIRKPRIRFVYTSDKLRGKNYSK